MYKNTAGITPYGFANQNPVSNIDEKGKYALFVHFRLTKMILSLFGVKEVQANLISHYASVFSDNPDGIKNTTDLESPSSVIISNIGLAKASPSFTDAEIQKLKYNPSIDYSKTQNSQSEDHEAQLIHGTRTLEESNFLSAEDAVSRSVSYAWDNLFASATEGHMDNLQINSEGMEKLGLALHTFQDVNAHKGAVFHPSWHGGIFDGMMSRHNEHSLWNDIFPEWTAYRKALNMTRTAVLVHQALSGDYSNFKSKNTLYTEGMSNEQYQKLSDVLTSGGFVIKKNDDGTSVVTKNRSNKK